MTVKNTSLNSTGFETLARGLNGEQIHENDGFIMFSKDGHANSSLVKEDFVNYLNGSKSDNLMARAKAPMLEKLCEEILPVGAVQVNATLHERIETGKYNSIFSDLYMYANKEQHDNCAELVGYLQAKLGKDNTKCLEDALGAVRNEKDKEGNSRQPKENETVMVMTKTKY